jgi:hypothetical protein
MSFGSGDSGAEWQAGSLGPLEHSFAALKRTRWMYFWGFEGVLFFASMVPYFSSNLALESRMPWKKRFIATSAGSWNQASKVRLGQYLIKLLIVEYLLRRPISNHPRVLPSQAEN